MKYFPPDIYHSKALQDWAFVKYQLYGCLTPTPEARNEKLKAGVFKSQQFEERFRKDPFSWRISVDGTGLAWQRSLFKYNFPERFVKFSYNWQA